VAKMLRWKSCRTMEANLSIISTKFLTICDIIGFSIPIMVLCKW